jgi:aminoglycoside/choline kinase family phosphotransferase
MVDHGIRKKNSISEVDAFIAIGRHLYAKGLPVPKIYLHDAFSGLVFLEDIGDVNLQKVVNEAKNLKEIIFCYQSVIRLLIKLSITGEKDFDPAWTHQTPTYDKRLILENECRYFVEAFLNGYLKWDTSFIDLQDDFFLIAENALASPLNGFMHRDMQSRNIMIKNNHIYFIDFQGGRIGPIQYDLASLLIDPYVDLPYPVRIDLLDYAIEKLSSILLIEKKKFCACFDYCAISRNLQILGAFGYLSRVKKKTHFEQYIPAAVKTLKQLLQKSGDGLLNGLKTVVEKIPNGGIT